MPRKIGPFQVKTWQIEACFVGAVLVTTSLISGNELKEWIGSLAVFFSFMYAQVNDRMSEDQSRKEVPTVECYKYSNRYFIAKEGLWLVYFLMSQTWAALVGVFIFLLYPLWRRQYLKKSDRVLP